jgi:hypothetical protein
MLHAGIAACLMAASLLLYDRLVLRPALVIGVVDLADVYRAKEAEFTRLLTKAGDAEQDRVKALALAQRFSERLPAVLDELPRECACLVVLKSAVAGAPYSLDLTPALRRKVDQP